MGVCMGKILGSGIQLLSYQDLNAAGKAVHCREREGDVEFFKRVFYLNIKGLWESFWEKR